MGTPWYACQHDYDSLGAVQGHFINQGLKLFSQEVSLKYQKTLGAQQNHDFSTNWQVIEMYSEQKPLF